MVRAIGIILFAWLWASPVLTDPLADAVELVEQSVDQMSAALRTDNAGERVRAVLDRHFDLRSMALSVLPAEIRDNASASELDTFITAYRAYLTREFVARSTGGGAGGMRVLGTRQPSAALITVGTVVTAPDQPRRVVEWYIRAAPPLRIVNATVDGVLVTAQQRRDFQDLLEAQGLAALSQALLAGSTGAGGGE